MDKMELFTVNNLNTDLLQGSSYVPVVRNVSFAIPAGSILGLIGESGSGKSVTAMTIAGMNRTPLWNVTGEVTLDGSPMPLTEDSSMRRLRGQEICFVMQNPMSAFDPLFTIRSHFMETRAAHGQKDRGETDRMAVELLERMRIAEPERVLRSYPFECSGGMLQRIMIAIAVMNRPKLLIADEPTTALDRTVQYEIIRILGELKESGSAILFISHDLKAVSYIADEIAVMYGGYIVEKGTVKQINETPRHPYTKALIHAVPQFSKEELPVLDGMPPSLLQRPAKGCPFAPRCVQCTERCADYGMVPVQSGGHSFCCAEEVSTDE